MIAPASMQYVSTHETQNDEVLMTPLYTHGPEVLVRQSGGNTFIYVRNDFELGAVQKVYVVMNNENGHRTVVLPMELACWSEGLD